MQYKLLVHGHKLEIRPGWYENVYKAWHPGANIPLGLHLVSYSLWEATPFDRQTMPQILKEHINFDKDDIV